jgi:hypothetical protein
MGMHSTIHGYDTATPEEGKPGRWRPVTVDTTGALKISGVVGGSTAEDAAHTTGDLGTMVLAVRRDAATSGVNADGDYASFNVDSNGRLRTIDDSAGATTGTPTSVASGTSAVTILAANANRWGATFTNDDANLLYLLVASSGTASSSVYSVPVAGNGGYYELPMLKNGKPYTGIITGIWAADGTGSVRVTEYTA